MYKLKCLLFFIFLIKSIDPLAAQTTQTLPVSLQNLFDLADENNRNLKILEYNEKIAAETIEEEKKKLLPSLDATLTASYNGDGWISDRNFSNGFSIPIPDFGNNFAIEAKQIIYAGSAINTSIDMAKTNLSISQLEKEKNRQNIRFMISGYYLELLKLENQKTILEKNIEQTNKLLAQIKSKFQQGTMLKNNVTRYELQLQSLDLALLKIKNTSTIINNELVKTSQLPKGTKLQLKDDLVETGKDLNENSNWQNLALANSAELKQLDLQTELSKNREKLVNSEKLPQVFAFAGNHLDGPIMIEIPTINQNFNYWYAGVGVKYNVASLYKNKNKQNQARLASKMVLECNELVKDQLENDIENASIRYFETLKVYETQLKGVELATENYTVIKNRYLNDLVLITEMLDAENSKVDAELQAANAQINILFHHYQLKKLTGTL